MKVQIISNKETCSTEGDIVKERIMVEPEITSARVYGRVLPPNPLSNIGIYVIREKKEEKSMSPRKNFKVSDTTSSGNTLS